MGVRFRLSNREKDEIMSGGEGTNLNSKQRRVKKGRRHFTRPTFRGPKSYLRQREKVLRGNEDPLAAVFSWGVSHHMRELGVIQQPKSKITLSIVLHSRATTKSKNIVLLYFVHYEIDLVFPRMITQNHSRCIKLNHSLPTMKLKKSKMKKKKKKKKKKSTRVDTTA